MSRPRNADLDRDAGVQRVWDRRWGINGVPDAYRDYYDYPMKRPYTYLRHRRTSHRGSFPKWLRTRNW